MARIESPRIARQLVRAVRGPAWHGPSFHEAIRGVSAADAARKPIPGAHSIWKLVLHTTAWLRIVRLRAEKRSPRRITRAMNWPDPGPVQARRWRRAVAGLDAEVTRLARTIRALDDERLPYLALHGVVQHTIYHAGQIVLLRKRALKVLP